MQYLISSNFSYLEKSYPFIVKSLIESGIKSEDIFIIVGSAPNNANFYKNEFNINIKFVEYNSFDFNALIYAAEFPDEIKSDYLFLLHDTCLVGKNFKKFSQIFEKDCIIKKLYCSISMNIGLYSKTSLKENYKKLLELKVYPKDILDLQKYKSFFVLKEDLIFKNYFIDSNKQYYALYKDNKDMNEEIFKLFDDYYHNFIKKLLKKRKMHYTPALDLYKFQANLGWQQKWIIEL